MRWIAVLFLPAVLLLAAACGDDGGEATPTATATSTATPIPPTDTPPPPNRKDCGKIRGTDYLSPQERTWFLSNCIEDQITDGACPGAMAWDQAILNVGKRATVRGPVAGTLYASGSNGQPTFLNVGRDYPDPDRFKVVIWGDTRDNFPFAPEVEYDNRTICATGLIEPFEGVAQIVADTPSDIEIVD